MMYLGINPNCLTRLILPRDKYGNRKTVSDVISYEQRYPVPSGQHDTAVSVVGGGMTGAL